jgi:biopolymer transport protein ExbD
MRTILTTGVLALAAAATWAAPALKPVGPPGPLVVELNARGEVVRPGEPPVPPQELKEFLTAEHARRKRAAERDRTPIEVRASLSVDGDTPYGRVIETLDALRTAGFTTLAIGAVQRP